MGNNWGVVYSSLAFAAVALLVVMAASFMLSQVSVIYASSNNIGENVVVPLTCIPLASNTAIYMPSIPAGSSQATSNVVTVTNYGNEPSNIFVDGGNPTYLSNVIWVSNIVWNDAYQASGAPVGNQLANSITGADTQLTASSNGGKATVYFGTNVPATSQPGTYTSTINVMLSC
ncbi:MAG: hypothetical protein KGI04_04480 [Candidatus Micrarchaeota archaeon]|nr:hypothetical protein [Candidatus Micrarchaeota archaeon]